MEEKNNFQHAKKDIPEHNQEAQQKAQSDFQHLVRISNTDIDGNQQLCKGLAKIKGLGFMFANAVANATNIEKTKKIGYLKEEEIKIISDIIKNPSKLNIPSWAFNRRGDSETGDDIHLTGAELDFVKENDMKIMKKIKSYKGIRHAHGLPVRGQKTKSNFRRNKGNVLGVKRKKGKSGRV